MGEAGVAWGYVTPYLLHKAELGSDFRSLLEKYDRARLIYW